MTSPNSIPYWDLVTRLVLFDVEEVGGSNTNIVVLLRMHEDCVGPFYSMKRMGEQEIVHRRVVAAILRRFQIDEGDWRRSESQGPK